MYKIGLLFILLLTSCVKEKIENKPFIVAVNNLGAVYSVKIVNDSINIFTSTEKDNQITFIGKDDSLFTINIGDTMYEFIYSDMHNKFTNSRP